MRYRLRTLLIVLAIGPALLAAMWLHWEMRLLLFNAIGTLVLGMITAWLSNTTIAR